MPRKYTATLPRRRTGIPVDVRVAVAGRSQGVCEAQLSGCLGTATEVHHRKTKKMGGRRRSPVDQLSSLLHLCHACHEWVTLRPSEAYEVGLSIREWEDADCVPVQYRGTLVFLDDLGGVTDACRCPCDEHARGGVCPEYGPGREAS